MNRDNGFVFLQPLASRGFPISQGTLVFAPPMQHLARTAVRRRVERYGSEHTDTDAPPQSLQLAPSATWSASTLFQAKSGGVNSSKRTMPSAVLIQGAREP